MRIPFIKLVSVLVMAACIVALPVHAADKEKKAKTTESSERKLPFHGKIAEIDKSAKSLKIGTRTFFVTSSTQMKKDGKDATLDDAKVGDLTGGSYQNKGEKLELVSIRFGPKPEEGAKADEKTEEPKKKRK